MSVKIGSNTISLLVQRNLADASTSLSKSFERLSSGQRINRASDDAAGLAISESLKCKSRVYGAAVRNVNDGVSYLNISDSALAELSNITARQIELAEQSANGVYDSTQRKAITAEANALVKEFNRIVQSAEFNGRKILDAESSSSSLRIQAGFGLDGGIGFGVGAELDRTVGTGNFGAATAYATTEPNYAVSVADINGDGAPDFVTAGGWAGGKAIVRINDGHGNFGSTVSYTTEGGTSYALSLVDINGDGSPDLVTAGGGGGGGKATIRFNDGHGAFGAATSYTTESLTSRALSVADMNGDGTPDLVTAGDSGSGGKVTIRLNDGHGNFGGAVSYSTGNVYSPELFVADLDGDGALDLVTAGYDGAGAAKVAVQRNDGLGHFGSSTFYTANDWCDALSVTDVNGDGELDLVTAGMIRLGDGHGMFGSARSYTSNFSCYALSMADVNGDGALDLVTAGTDLNGKASIRLNDGQGSFSSATSYTTEHRGSYAVTVTDINGDGAPDLVTAGDVDPTGAVTVRTAFAHNVTTIAALDLFTPTAARQALVTLMDQLDRIGSERGNIGSAQSRLSAALNTLTATRENFDTAASRITDVDVAQEAAQMTRTQITQQAASAVLAQANQAPQIALALLKGSGV